MLFVVISVNFRSPYLYKQHEVHSYAVNGRVLGVFCFIQVWRIVSSRLGHIWYQGNFLEWIQLFRHEHLSRKKHTFIRFSSLNDKFYL